MSLVDTVKQTFRVGSLALALAFSSMTVNSCSTVIPQVQQTQIDRYSKTVKSQFQSNPSGYFQKTVDEITQDIKEDMERMDGKELEHYLQVTSTANLETHIRNFQRYPIELLEESNRNITDPNYKADLPIALAFMGVYDHTNNILGIRALDVKPKELMDLTEGYKLIVFEYATKKELTEQMEKVARLFPEPGKIKGLVMGGHGKMKSIISGDQEKDESINVDDISEIFQPHVDLFNKDAIVFLAACYSGLEEGKEKNMANAFAEALLERRVYSCNEQLIDFNYELDENNQVDPDSINLYTFGPTGWPFSNCTYVAFSEVGPKKWSKEEQFYYKYGKEGKRKLKFLEEGGIPSKLIVDNSLDPRSMNYTCKCIDYGWSNATGLSIEDTAAALSMSVEELLSRKVAIVCSSEEILYQGSQLQKQGNEQVLLEGRCMLVVNK